SRLPLHAIAMLVYSLLHTSLLWVTRNPLYRLFGLHPYDYGVMTARYPMEFCHDVIAYTLMVAIPFLVERHARGAAGREAGAGSAGESAAPVAAAFPVQCAQHDFVRGL